MGVSQKVRIDRRNFSQSESSHFTSQLRDSPVNGRCRLTSGPRDAGPRQHCDNSNLHSRRPNPPEKSPQAIPSTRVKLIGNDFLDALNTNVDTWIASANLTAGVVAEFEFFDQRLDRSVGLDLAGNGLDCFYGVLVTQPVINVEFDFEIVVG